MPRRWWILAFLVFISYALFFCRDTFPAQQDEILPSTLAPPSQFQPSEKSRGKEADLFHLEAPSRAFLGIRSMGLFGPLSYWRSEEDWGVGDLDTLLEVIAFAKQTNQSIVQILPPNIPLFDNYPYGNASAYVFDPVYIGIQGLFHFLGVKIEGAPTQYLDAVKEVATMEEQIRELRNAPKSTNDQTRQLKSRVFEHIYKGFQAKELEGKSDALGNYLIGVEDRIDVAEGSPLVRRFKEYCLQNRSWLGDHLLFFCLLREFKTDDFRQWPSEVALRDPEIIGRLKREHVQEILYGAFLQWVWKEQIDHVSGKAQEGEKKVDIMLDQPFAFGNADVWINPDAFLIHRESLKRERTQGAPPHTLDVPQHWDFTLLDPGRPEAKKLLLDRLNYLLRFCNVLRIDHLLGYYRSYNITEDIGWDTTLESLGVWDSIQEIFESPLSPAEKRQKIYLLVVDALKKRLPHEILQGVFDESGLIRHAHVILAARRDFDRKVDPATGKAQIFSPGQCGWYEQSCPEHKDSMHQGVLLFTMLNPSEYGSIDYLEKIIREKGMFLKPTDSIRVGYFSLGLGEEIVASFMAAAQEQGKTLVFENLGVVPGEVQESLWQLGASQFCPLTFGYKLFIGDHNNYWFDRIRSTDYACFSTHDGVTLKCWWERKGRWAEKCYFKSDEARQGVIDWLRHNGYLAGDAPVSLQETTWPFEHAVLATVADSRANMAVFMMPDIFGSGEEGIIHIPGTSGWWTTRAPVTIEAMTRAAATPAGQRGDSEEEMAVSLIEALAQKRDRDSFAKQVEGLDPAIPHLIWTHPITAPTYKQLAFAGGHFIVDAFVYGACKMAHVVFEDGKEYPMREVRADSGLPPSTQLFRAVIPVGEELVKTSPFRISLDERIVSEHGYLIGLASGVDANPLSQRYGQIVSPKRLPENIITEDFFHALCGQLGDWMKTQRWFLEKDAALTGVRLVDYFELTKSTDEPRSFGILVEAMTRKGGTTSRHVYYLALNFFADTTQAGSASVAKVEGREMYFEPAEHTTAYQREMVRRLIEAASLVSAGGNKVVFKPASKALVDTFGQGKLATRDLLARTGMTTSNVLTSAAVTREDTGALQGVLVIKTYKKAGDIEAEMYSAAQGDEHIPTFLGQVTIDIPQMGHVPLCIFMDRITMPPGLQRWEALAAFHIGNAFLTAYRSCMQQSGTKDASVLGEEVMRKSLGDLIFSKVSNEGLVRGLGEVIGGLHVTLAKSMQEGFGIRRASSSDLGVLQDKYIEKVIQEIRARVADLTDEVSGYVTEFMKAHSEKILGETRRTLDGLPDIHLSRIHGDMRLEQIAFDKDLTLRILDLGGAPTQTAQEKRMKTFALYDIAGVIRSFGYVKNEALKDILRVDNVTLNRYQRGEFGEMDGPAIARIQELLFFAGEYEDRMRRVLVDSYWTFLEKAGATDLLMEKWDRGAAEKVLRYCVVARALHEIKYELSARPEEKRVFIPLMGLAAELQRMRPVVPGGSKQMDAFDSQDMLVGMAA